MNLKDEQTGIYTTTEYRQDHPCIGQVAATCSYLDGAAKTCGEVAASPGATLVSSLANTWSHKSLNLGKTKFPFVATSVAQTFEPNDGAANGYVTQVTTSSTYDDYGNPLEIGVVTTDGTMTHSKVSTNVYAADDVAKWHLGRLTQASVVSTVPDTIIGSGTLSTTRTSSFAYDASTGLLVEEVIEPGSALEQKTSYTYDAFGNKATVSVTLDHDLDGGAVTPLQTRTTTTEWGERDPNTGAVTANGRFPVTVTNALSQAEMRTYDGASGRMTALTGPNGLTTTWTHDGFGRPLTESRADGTSTLTSRSFCPGAGLNCPAAAHYAVISQATGAAKHTVYFDALDRELRRETEGFDGTPVFEDTEYYGASDGAQAGRVKRRSRAYYQGDSPAWESVSYDVQSNPLAVSIDTAVQYTFPVSQGEDYRALYTSP